MTQRQTKTNRAAAIAEITATLYTLTDKSLFALLNHTRDLSQTAVRKRRPSVPQTVTAEVMQMYNSLPFSDHLTIRAFLRGMCKGAARDKEGGAGNE